MVLFLFSVNARHLSAKMKQLQRNMQPKNLVKVQLHVF